MAEILVRATSSAHADPVVDQRGCYKRGMPVVVMPDGHPWGRLERLPTFVVIKLPLVSVERVQKYIAPQTESQVVEGEVHTVTTRRRIWRIRWADLPLIARTKLQNAGELVIKAHPDYLGVYDFTWEQVRDYFQNQQTMLNETENP